MVTQKDIARRLGISPSLVSRVLSGKGAEIGAAPETVRRIETAARRLRYAPSAAALSLRGGPAHTIGLVVTDFADPFFGRVVSELQRLAHAAGYSLIVSGSSSGQPQDADLREIVRHRLDGVLMVGTQPRLRWLRQIVAPQTPAVQIGLGPRVKGMGRVAVDEYRGCELLLRHLTAANCRHFAWAGRETYAHRHRLRSFQRARRAIGSGDTGAAALVAGSGLEAGYRSVCELLARSRLPDAILGLDDEAAQGAMRALDDAGIAVPRRVMVTGFDDLPAAAMMRPSLTTVRQPLELLVRRAFAKLLSGTGGECGEPESFAPELIIRESSNGS